MTSGTDERALQAVAARALDLIGDGARVGLGSGRAAATFIVQLGERVRQGLRVAGVPTSEASGRLARALGIPLIELDDEVIDGQVRKLLVDECAVLWWGDDEDALSRNEFGDAVDGVLQEAPVAEQVQELLGAISAR